MHRTRNTPLRTILLTGAILGTTLLVALLTPSQGGVTATVEALSSSSSNLLSTLGTLIPFGFAFTAGMVSAVNPCGFVMLPTYLALFLGQAAEPGERTGVGDATAGPDSRAGLATALRVSAAVTAGFVLLFGVMGAGISVGLRSLTGFFPWLGLGTGVLLIGIGIWLALGGVLTMRFSNLPAQLDDGSRTLRGYVTYGVAYGLTSLSCTLPIFLAVTGTSLTFASLPQVGLQFLLYALGMGSIILILTLSLAYVGRGFSQRLRQAQRFIAPLGAILMTGAGTYTVFYWLTVGGLLKSA